MGSVSQRVCGTGRLGGPPTDFLSSLASLLCFDFFSLTGGAFKSGIPTGCEGSSTNRRAVVLLLYVSVEKDSRSGRTIGFFLNVTGSSSSPPSSAPKLSSFTSLENATRISDETR